MEKMFNGREKQQEKDKICKKSENLETEKKKFSTLKSNAIEGIRYKILIDSCWLEE